MTEIERELRRSYDRGAEAWATGASLVYRRLARALVERSPIPLAGRLVLDAGAGTGVAADAAIEAGARVISSDAALGMLRYRSRVRPPAACADVASLCFRTRTFDGVVAACVLNHVPDLHAALTELARVVRAGGVILASAFSERQHPAKVAIDDVLARHGFDPPRWFTTFKSEREPQTAWIDNLRDAATRAGLTGVDVEDVGVDLSMLDAEALVGYRLGLAHVQPFLTSLDARSRAALEHEAAIGCAPTLDVPMSLLVLLARVPG
jgi:ubiquinone/menaquinone biosynthesis C-methylase UbiE